MSEVRRESEKCGLCLFLCLKGSDKLLTFFKDAGLDAKGNVKGVRNMEIVDYLVENVQFFVVGITPYYYEHGVFMEDHDGVRMKYRIQKLIYRDQVQIYIKGQ